MSNITNISITIRILGLTDSILPISNTTNNSINPKQIQNSNTHIQNRTVAQAVRYSKYSRSFVLVCQVTKTWAKELQIFGFRRPPNQLKSIGKQWVING